MSKDSLLGKTPAEIIAVAGEPDLQSPHQDGGRELLYLGPYAQHQSGLPGEAEHLCRQVLNGQPLVSDDAVVSPTTSG